MYFRYSSPGSIYTLNETRLIFGYVSPYVHRGVNLRRYFNFVPFIFVTETFLHVE